MVNVQYTHDDIDQQLNKPLDEVKQLPQSITLHYCLKPEYLTQADLEVARTKDYHQLVKKYGYQNEYEYAVTTFKQFKLTLYLISAICAFGGMYYSVINILTPERVQSFTHYALVLFLVIQAGYYYLSITILEIKMTQAWRNRLKVCGRLLFPQELASGLFIKYIISALIAQFMIVLIFDASISLVFSN